MVVVECTESQRGLVMATSWMECLGIITILTSKRWAYFVELVVLHCGLYDIPFLLLDQRK